MLFDYEIVSRDREAKRIDVRLTVVPRKSVDLALAQLRKAGLTPRVIDLLDANPEAAPQINLLGRTEKKKKRGKGLKITLHLLLVGVLAVIGIIAFQLHQPTAEPRGPARNARRRARAGAGGPPIYGRRSIGSAMRRTI